MHEISLFIAFESSKGSDDAQSLTALAFIRGICVYAIGSENLCAGPGTTHGIYVRSYFCIGMILFSISNLHVMK